MGPLKITLNCRQKKSKEGKIETKQKMSKHVDTRGHFKPESIKGQNLIL